MRRLALAIAITSFHTDPVLAQSQVRHVPSSAAETTGANGPLPGASDPTHPPTPNPAAPLKVSRRDKEPSAPVRSALPDRDQLSGHFRLAATIAFGTLSGSFLKSSPIGAQLGGSPLAGVDLGYGLTRQLELVLAADYSTALSGSGCKDCGAISWAVGPMFRYHLVEGTRFAPWLAIGVAYRHNALDGFPSSAVNSIEYLRIQLGGDWYATSKIAFGPVLGCGLAGSAAAHANEGSGVFALFYAGVRVALDFPGR